MKRIAAFLLALTLMLALCACGNSGDNGGSNGGATTGSSTKAPSTTPIGYTFTYQDYQFGVDMAADAVFTALGEAEDSITSKSCAFGGDDTVYYYGSFEVYTNNEDGYERIYSIFLKDDLVSTEEGVCVGNSAEDVKAAYGEPGDLSNDACMIYEKDGMTLTFNMVDGKVDSISYSYI